MGSFRWIKLCGWFF